MSGKPSRKKRHTSASKGQERPEKVHTSLYLPAPTWRAIWAIAHERREKERQRVRAHDVVLEGIELVLRKYRKQP